MPDPVDRLLKLLDLEPIGPDRFRAANPDAGYGTRVFGGQVAAQAIRAAVATVEPDRSPHSLHAYFLRPGRPGVPIVFEVERTHDGRSFTTRRVLALQGEEVIFEMSTSLHVVEPGVDYQMPIAAGSTPPEVAAGSDQFHPGVGALDRLPMEMRELGATEADEAAGTSTRRVWMKVRRPLPDDPLLHVCVLTYLSDMGAVMGAVRRSRRNRP